MPSSRAASILLRMSCLANPLARTTALAALIVLSVAPTATASFLTHLVQIGPGGIDSSIDSVAEAEALLDGGLGGYEVLTDRTALRTVIDLGTEGDFGLDLAYPDGSTGDSIAGPFTKEQFAVRARATLTIPPGDWTIAFGSDEGGKLVLPGISFTNELNTLGDSGLDDEITYDGLRSHGQTLGQFTLATATTTDLDAFFFEATGADGFEISIAAGHFPSHDPVNFQPLVDGVLGVVVTPTPDVLIPSDAAANDRVGYAVAIDGDTAVVGAYLDDDGGNESGSAYVFERAGTGWVQKAKLVAGDAAANDRFGFSVGISGDTVVVGASRKPTNFTGAAYVFVEPPGGWAGTLSHDAKLGASDAAASSEFGFSIAIAGDNVVVGAPVHDAVALNAGQAYVFAKPGGGWAGVLTEDAQLRSSDLLASDNFGVSVSASGDRLVVGSKFHDSEGFNAGAAYVFLEPAGGWPGAGLVTESAKLTASDAAIGDQLGFAVAISGSRIAVGAPQDDDGGSATGSVYVFVEPGGGWIGSLNEVAKLAAGDATAGDNLGHAVAISDLTIVAGAPFKDLAASDSGAAYVFIEPASGWSGTLGEDRRLVPLGALADDEVGTSVAVANDIALVGAPETLTGRFGKAFLYRLEDTGVDPCAGVDCSAFDGACHVAACNPANGLCELSSPRPAGTLCRAGSGDLCDPDEFCDGVLETCPADTFEPATTVCNPGSGDVCDPDELCLGIAGAACPADLFAPTTTVCRVGSGDLCDPDETCTGLVDTACPADTFEPATTVCNPGSGDVCDPDELCLGIAGAACPADLFAPTTTVCNPSGTGDETCDPSEYCAGLADVACPADFIAPLATACGDASATACTQPDSCDGAGICLVNNQACGMLSDQSLCIFDASPSKGTCVDGSGQSTGEACDVTTPACSLGTCIQTSQFELLFTPDEQNAPSFELSSSHPRQFFYNVFYDGPFPASLTVTIPYPFVTQGTTPVHVYDGAAVAALDGCLLQPEPVAVGTQQVAIGDYLGLAVSPGVTCDLVCDPSGTIPAFGTCFGGGQDGDACEVGDPGDACVLGGGSCAPGGSCRFDLALEDPGSGLAYVNVLLDYGLEGRNTDANPCADGLVDRYEPGAADPLFGGADALTSLATGPGSLGIANGTGYEFAHTDGVMGFSDLVQNRSRFGYSLVETIVSYSVEGGQPSSLTYAGGAVTVRPADALELATAVLVFAEFPDSPIEDIDALHVLPDGKVLFSTSTDVTQGFAGLASFQDGDVVQWDPLTGLATVVLDESLFEGATNVDALTVLPNGHWLLSTSLTATLGGLTFLNGDIVEYDPVANVASLYLGLSEAFLFTGSNPDIDGLHRLDDGSLLISVRTAGVGTIGSNFGFVSADASQSDVFVYDPATDLAMRYLDGAELYDDPDGAGPLEATRNLDALFVPEPTAPVGLLLGGALLALCVRRRAATLHDRARASWSSRAS